MEGLPTVDRETAEVVRQITAEVKQGKPIKIIHNEVDVNLMNKLFSGKRFMAVGKEVDELDTTPRCLKKKKSEIEEEKIDKILLNMLFKGDKRDEAFPSTCSPSPPLPSPLNSVQNPSAAPVSHHQRTPKSAASKSAQDDFIRLQKEAIEAQIAKDRMITKYYRRKLELLDQRTDLEHK